VVEVTPALAALGGPGLIGVVSYGVGKENNL